LLLFFIIFVLIILFFSLFLLLQARFLLLFLPVFDQLESRLARLADNEIGIL
jgi:hypothetical protein